MTSNPEMARLLDTVGAAMWEHVARHTGRVGYRRGAKAEGLLADPQVIDCSGWVTLLLRAGMTAADRGRVPAPFEEDDRRAVDTWSDRMIAELERRFGFLLEGDRISLEALPPYATIGLCQGGGEWATNRPRPRGITHIVQLVRRPCDDAAFVSEAQGWDEPTGIRLTPLSDWLDMTREHLTLGRAWAVDAFGALGAARHLTPPRPTL